MTHRQANLIRNMKPKDLILNLYMTQILLFIISIVLAFFIFSDASEFKQIWTITDIDILVVGGGVGISVILIDFLLMKFLPRDLLDDGGINERIFQSLNIPHIFVLCILISFVEEFLFRGMIQTQFGLLIASLVFALLHIRYLTKWVLFTVVVSLSFVLGYVFQLTGNLWVTIFAHFVIDFVAALKIRFDFLKQ
jgi:uncharacterized protein